MTKYIYQLVCISHCQLKSDQIYIYLYIYLTTNSKWPNIYLLIYIFSLPIKIDQIYIDSYISHYQSKVTKYISTHIYLTTNLTRSNLDVLTNRIFILYKDYITPQTKIPTMNFKPWSSIHPLSGAITSTRTNNSDYQVSRPTVTPGHWNGPSRYQVWIVQMGVGTGTGTRPNQILSNPEDYSTYNL